VTRDPYRRRREQVERGLAAMARRERKAARRAKRAERRAATEQPTEGSTRE
jgi:hypothetical protein